MKGKKSNQARFPIARIKKLIQADEDVGKVAQATPIVISKALELFLSSLVAECVKDAQARGIKKITAHGLKRTITNVPTFDFCADIVAGVQDPITDDTAGAGGEKGLKKRRAPAGTGAARKKKVKVDEEEEGDEGNEDEEEEDEKPKKKRASRAKKPKNVEEQVEAEQEVVGAVDKDDKDDKEAVDEEYEEDGHDDDEE